MSLFADLVRREDSPHCSKTPTRTFRAATVALADLGTASTAEVARAAGNTWANTDLILARLRRYGCATLARDTRAARGHRSKVWTVTDLGRRLAAELAPVGRSPGGDDQ